MLLQPCGKRAPSTQCMIEAMNAPRVPACRLLAPGKTATRASPVDAQDTHANEQGSAQSGSELSSSPCDVPAQSALIKEQSQDMTASTSTPAEASVRVRPQSEPQPAAMPPRALQHVQVKQELPGAQKQQAPAQLGGAAAAEAAVPHGMQMLLDAQPPTPLPLRSDNPEPASDADRAPKPGVLMLLCILDLMPR